MISRRNLILGGATATLFPSVFLRLPLSANAQPAGQQDKSVTKPWAAKLISAASSQIGQTVLYDPSYVRLDFPGGDVPMDRGVCTDVIIRAYRRSNGFDLQERVNKDMKAAFDEYPKIWGAKRTDSNIDHRRVPNLAAYFKRSGAKLATGKDGKDFQPGDLVTQMLPGNLPHIALVTHQLNGDGSRPLVIHNIGSGTRLEDRLFDFPITGHFRFDSSTV